MDGDTLGLFDGEGVTVDVDGPDDGADDGATDGATDGTALLG